MKKLLCKISSIDAVSNTVYRVRLIPKKDFYFRAGQYLILRIDGLDNKPFSLASTPLETTFIELHIYSSKCNLYGIATIDSLLKRKEITVKIPYGDAWLREDSNRPILLIAGGIGFSYTRSILLTVLKKQPQRKVEIYWGVREQSHFYNLKELDALTLQHSQLSVIKVVDNPCNQWHNGRANTVLMEVMQNYISLEHYDIYIAGRFEMAKKAREFFCSERHALVNHIFSDAFHFFK